MTGAMLSIGIQLIKKLHSELVTFLIARIKYLTRSNLEESSRHFAHHGGEGMATGRQGGRSHCFCNQEVGLG